jgi:hypothetical protein
VIVGVLLAAGGFAGVRHLVNSGSNGARSAALDGIASSSAAGTSSAAASPTPTPSSKLKPAMHISRRPSPKPTHSHTTAPAPPPPPVASAHCANPRFVTSDPSGGWTSGRYFVYNNMWNASGYSVSQTLRACAFNNWYVVANMNNDRGDGAVKTYPNVHEDFNEPAINSFHSITSTFAETSPHTGIYEDAYDIWLNGVADSGSTEVMVWNDNWHQAPSGSRQGTVTFGGRTYTAWHDGSYIAFTANTNFSSGTVNLLEIFKWIMARGWIPSSSTLGQIDYGAEIVSTNSAPATFTINNFSISTS